MKKLNYLYFVVLISCGLGLIGCSDSLKSQFDVCYTKKSNPNELLNNSKLKERIVKEYSQQYYEKLLECSNIYSPIYYDSIQNCYRLYTWKEHKYKNENSVRLRYYIDKDSVAINLFINDWEIDKSGYSDYPNPEKMTDQDIQSIEGLANKGIATAQGVLGLCYATGNIIEKNKEKALLWMHKAAIQNLSEAQYVRAIWEEDEKIGVEWLQKSAEQDNISALTTLANLYIKGTVVPKDYAKALKLYQHAARFDTNTQYLLGEIYWDSKLVDSDKKKAMQWFTKAAENNNIDAQITLGSLYMEGEDITKDLSKSLEWFTKAAELGDPDAQYLLARIYMQDEMDLVLNDYPSMETLRKMASQNMKEGVKWLRKSAEQGKLSAQRSLGAYYYNKEHNQEEARIWFHKAAEQGDNSWIAYPGMY